MKIRVAALVFLLFSSFCFAQTEDSTSIEVDSVAVDTVAFAIPDNGIQNAAALVPFFRKLSELNVDFAFSKGKKINIVHVGDSHIQADLFTDRVRKNLQRQFGNGGRGFVFPHNLARTNGSWDIRFSSNQSWQNHRAVSPVDGSPVGLSGIALWTRSDDFAVEFNSKSMGNEFNTIKIVTPQNRNSFDLATAQRSITLESDVPKLITHKIKSGEVLGSIANKYQVSVAQLKKANRLKSNLIRAGKTLKIPTGEMQKRRIQRAEFVPLPLQEDALSHFYHTDNSLEKIFLLPAKDEKEFVLSGLVMENNSSGVLYHNIGVNGAQLGDYNKYALFFEQLPVLQPDLVVISFGTNESFGKMPTVDFIAQLDTFIDHLRDGSPNTNILVLTPAPSLFKRRYANTFAAAYAKAILQHAPAKNYAVWDMHAQLGGTFGVNRNYRRGLMAADRVHYSKVGYELQGDLLSEAIVNTYGEYLKSKD